MNPMHKSAVLIHGKGGSPTTSWLPWMRQQLASNGILVEAPVFPPEPNSKLSEWLAILNSLSTQQSQTVYIAHARGAMALLRWINTLPTQTHIAKIITVSCNFDYIPLRQDGDDFYLKPLNYSDIKAKCRDIVVIHSQDDPYVPIVAGQEPAKNLDARFVGYVSAGHFGADKLQAPEILKEL